MRNNLIRTAKTFIAVLIPILATAIVNVDWGNWRAVVVVVGTSLVTAIMNMPGIKQFFNNYGELEGVIERLTEEELQELFLKDKEV